MCAHFCVQYNRSKRSHNISFAHCPWEKDLSWYSSSCKVESNHELRHWTLCTLHSLFCWVTCNCLYMSRFLLYPDYRPGLCLRFACLFFFFHLYGEVEGLGRGITNSPGYYSALPYVLLALDWSFSHVLLCFAVFCFSSFTATIFYMLHPSRICFLPMKHFVRVSASHVFGLVSEEKFTSRSYIISKSYV